MLRYLCSCKGPEEALCPTCVEESLRGPLELQRRALEERDRRREWCRERLTELRNSEEKQRDYEGSKDAPSERSSDTNSANQQLSLDDRRNPAKLKSEADRLRSKLSTLVHQCNSAAIARDQLTVSNDVRDADLIQLACRLNIGRNGLHTLYDSPETGIISALEHATSDALDSNRRIRLQLALQAFEMHRIDVGPENKITGGEATSSPSKSKKMLQRQPRGIGKIGGLPLPHAGPVLYGALPAGVLTSALRMVGSLTSILARVLGVSLPHPILLRRREGSEEHLDEEFYTGDIASIDMFNNPPALGGASSIDGKAPGYSQTDGERQQSNGTSTREVLQRQELDESLSQSAFSTSSSQSSDPGPYGSKSSSPSPWSFRGAAAAAISRTSRALLLSAASSSAGSSFVSSKRLHMDQNTQQSPKHCQSLPMDQQSVNKRVKHATAVIVREKQTLCTKRNGDRGSKANKDSPVTEFELNAGKPGLEEFNVGLQFLQNDIVALCIHAGVPVSTLWPAEAVLLNLNSLRVFCREQIE